MKTPYLMPRVQLTLSLFMTSSAPLLFAHNNNNDKFLFTSWNEHASLLVLIVSSQKGEKGKCIKAPRGKNLKVIWLSLWRRHRPIIHSVNLTVGVFLLFYFIFISSTILDFVPCSNVPDAGILSPSLLPLSQPCWILQSCFKVIYSVFSNSRYIFRASSRGSQSPCVTFRACGLYVFLIRIFLLMCSEYD